MVKMKDRKLKKQTNFYELFEILVNDLETLDIKVQEIINLLSDFMFNKRGLIEGQCFQDKILLKKGGNPEILKRNEISNAKSLYDFFIPNEEKCAFNDCQEPARFRGLKNGYAQYCRKCSQTRNNHMSEGTTVKINYVNLSLKDTLQYIKDKNGGYSTAKLKRIHPNVIRELRDITNFITWDASNAERFYCYENNIISLNDLPKCEICKTHVTRFYASSKGYWSYHQGECAKKRKKETITNDLRIKHRKIRSSSVYERMKSTPDGYTRLKDFDEENYLNTGTDYITLECTEKHQYNLTNHYQGDFRCKICFPSRSKTQTNIYEFLKPHDSDLLYDDRRLIAPKETDILSHKFRFAIEYNSQNFHSSGESAWTILDKKFSSKYHLDKTELVEEQDYQLFHIFSSEYLNETKKQIWNSMLLNKMNISEKIYARKCEIKEITSSEARLFCETNHIQGYVNSSIRIGLFYNEQLVQIMTFGKPRQGKYKGSNNYELLRMCSLLNHVVIGGASKLLKYFERTYQPELILSYANRRWAYRDNVYPKLGFELVSISPPNYFYFLPKDECELESRVKYQKHKLKDYPEYSDDLTEAEIMFKRGYRKIYDSGNYVYVKRY